MNEIAFAILIAIIAALGWAWLDTLRQLRRAERERDDLWDEQHLGDAP